MVDQIRAADGKSQSIPVTTTNLSSAPQLSCFHNQDTNHLGNWTEDLLWYPGVSVASGR